MAQTDLSTPVAGLDYITSAGFRFPFGNRPERMPTLLPDASLFEQARVVMLREHSSRSVAGFFEDGDFLPGCGAVVAAVSTAAGVVPVNAGCEPSS